MTTIYWAGGEDSEMVSVNTGTSINTTTSNYRSSYARCCLLINNDATGFFKNISPWSASSFWFSAQNRLVSNNFTLANTTEIAWADSSGIKRLAMVGNGATNSYKLIKYDSGGAATQLGSAFTVGRGVAAVEKLDFNIVYAVSGSFSVYLNGSNTASFTFTGDVTTNSVTSLSYHWLASACANSGSGRTEGWSEIIVSDTDTRTWSLQTLAPVANGNTHNFDTGSPAAANVNEVVLNDTTLDGSTTAGQIDQYTIPSLVTGTYGIVAIGVSARLTKGTVSGPTKMDLGVRSGTTDFWSPDQVLTTAFSSYQNWWSLDPNTSSGWTGLPVNIGLKSVT